jgi:type II secretory pathway predicted ATPase ExeA
MFTTYFGFTHNPFTKHVPAEALFRWKDFENLTTRLKHFVTEGGVFLLTGNIGAGKTTALRAFAQALNPNTHRVVYTNDILDSRKDFYSALLTLFGVTPSHYAGTSQRILRKHLRELAMVKKQMPIVILDEAQNLPAFILEEVRLLMNSEFDSESLVHFILSGHKLLQQRMSLHENEALRQRITLKFHVHGLSLEETCAYVYHRLETAGSSHEIITDAVLAKIHEQSRGIPRMINKICYALLLAAWASEKKIIDDTVFDMAKNEWL